MLEKEKERKDNVTDYDVGIPSGTIHCLDKNKAKPACVGVESAVMVVGTVLFSPVGTVTGNIGTGALTEKAIKHRVTARDSTQNNEEHRQPTHKSIPSIPGPSVLLVPQGLLFKRRNHFKVEWRPWWFILDVEDRILNYHTITKNAPSAIDVNILNLFKKPVSHGMNQDDKIDFQLESQESLTLAKSKIEISKKLTNTKQNMYVFIITTEKKTWYLAATTAESRQMWVAMLMDLSGLNTYSDILSTC